MTSEPRFYTSQFHTNSIYPLAINSIEYPNISCTTLPLNLPQDNWNEKRRAKTWPMACMSLLQTGTSQNSDQYLGTWERWGRIKFLSNEQHYIQPLGTISSHSHCAGQRSPRALEAPFRWPHWPVTFNHQKIIIIIIIIIVLSNNTKIRTF